MEKLRACESNTGIHIVKAVNHVTTLLPSPPWTYDLQVLRCSHSSSSSWLPNRRRFSSCLTPMLVCLVLGVMYKRFFSHFTRLNRPCMRFPELFRVLAKGSFPPAVSRSATTSPFRIKARRGTLRSTPDMASCQLVVLVSLECKGKREGDLLVLYGGHSPYLPPCLLHPETRPKSGRTRLPSDFPPPLECDLLGSNSHLHHGSSRCTQQGGNDRLCHGLLG